MTENPLFHGMAEVIYSKEPPHCEKKQTHNKNSKRKKKKPSLFSLTNPPGEGQSPTRH